MPGSKTHNMQPTRPAANRNDLWARALLDELARAGVRELVLSPGSRSTPLVLAAAEDGRFRIRVQIDERSAAFLALGMGKATAFPAAVITTSGTAVANLLPAVVEAHLSETPLLLLTADRPARLHGADANQTIEQAGMFGSHIRLFADLAPSDLSEGSLRHLRSLASRAVATAVGSPAGAVHLNLPFDTPLEPTPVGDGLPEALARGETAGSGGRPDDAPWTVHLAHRHPPSRAALDLVAEALAASRRPLLVAGILPRPWETGPLLRRSAAQLEIPLLADPLSGGRYRSAEVEEGTTPAGAGDATMIGGYDILLRESKLREALRPDLIVRVGAAPVSTLLTDWMASLEGVPHILVDGGGRWKDHTGSVTHSIPSDSGAFLEALLDHPLPAREEGVRPTFDPEWLSLWQRAEEGVVQLLNQTFAPGSDGDPFEGMVAARVVQGIPEGELLFVSNSMPVRDLDTFVLRSERGLTVLGNRGASGIDGIISTAVGASLATGKRVTALVGDVALLHDANGLASLREPDARVVLVVVNNDGGGIFHFLPIRNFEPAYTPYFATPHGRDFRHLAELHGIPHRRVDFRGPRGDGGDGDVAGLRANLNDVYAGAGCQIIEVVTDRIDNREVRSRLVHEIAAAAWRSLGAAV